MASRVDVRMRSELISLPDFGSALQELSTVFEEVDRAVCGQKTLQWVVTGLSRGSAVVELTPQLTSQHVQDRREAIVAACIDGLDELDSRAELPKFFSDRALGAVQRFARFVDSVGPITVIGVSGGRPVKRVSVTQRIVANVSALISAAGQYSGAIEGQIEVLSIHGGFAITIYDPHGGPGVRCLCSQELFTELQNRLGERVLVYGDIRYNRRGQATEIKVEHWRPLRGRLELPQPDDLRGLTSEQPIDVEELSRTLRE